MAQYNYSPRYGLENYSYVFPFEDTFNPVESTKWMQNNWTHSITFSILYVLGIYAGQRFMESRKPFLLNGALFYWNLFLAAFSFMGLVRMTPEMFWSVNSNSFTYSICTASYAQGVTGYWTEKFAMSKVFEFIDTAFIVLRKRQLIFLHWQVPPYNRLGLYVACLQRIARLKNRPNFTFIDHTASGRWFIWMNYLVHSFMYFYYALRAAKIHVPKAGAMFVTVIQILQMIMGVYIGITIYGIKSAGRPCQQTWDNLYFSFAIYGSYFILFANFFFQSYIRSNRYNSPQKLKSEAGKKTDSPAESKTELLENGKQQNGTVRRKTSAELKHNGVEKTSGPVTRRKAQRID